MLPSVFATTPVEELRRLVETYSTAVPRYTSYPTAVEFHSGVGATDWAQQCVQDSARYGATTSVALYVHVPFCHSLCYFCACNKKIVKDDSEVGPYLEAVGAEVRTYGEILRTSPALQQLHWGGGTPNFLSPTATEELFGLCREVFPEATANADISVEIDPRTVTPAHLETYRRLGFTRVSAGVQDFCLDVQEAINRVQPYELTKEICDGVRSLGFSGLNLDLIYGLPEQTEATFADTIEKVLTIRPDRIALYGYAHVTWKKKVQRSLERHSLPSPDTRIRLFLQALGSLTRAGYVYIGMDHFALPDDSLSLALGNGALNRNFMGYSTHRGSDVFGIGVSAVSSIPSAFAQNSADLEEYMNKARSGQLPVHRGIIRSPEDQLRAAAIEDLLCLGAIDIAAFERTWSVSFWEHFSQCVSELQILERDSLITIEPSRLTVLPLGRLFLRNIAAVFDAYLAAHRQKQASVFSQSV